MLGRYVDALYVSLRGTPIDGLAEALSGMKEALRKTGGREEEPVTVPGIPGGSLRLQRWGRDKYAFVLHNEALRVEITTDANLPAMLIQFAARTLYEHDLDGLESMVDALAEFFLQPGYKVLVREFHLALDFQGEGWMAPHPDDVISRVKKPNVHYRTVEGRNVPETMTYGTKHSDQQVQIYDKTAELKKSRKTWMYDVWRKNAEYAEDLTVWRVEYRLRRKKLRKLGINTIADLRARMGNLIRSVVGGDDGKNAWIRVVSPETRSRRQDRRTAAPWWKKIREASLDETIATVAPNQLRAEGHDFAHTQKSLFAYLERFMALGAGEGLHPEETSLEEFARLMVVQYSEHLDSMEITRSEAIAARRREKMGLGSTPPSPATSMAGRH